jgi:hypothetical protein
MGRLKCGNPLRPNGLVNGFAQARDIKHHGLPLKKSRLLGEKAFKMCPNRSGRGVAQDRPQGWEFKTLEFDGEGCFSGRFHDS